jgi:hypothetical protein
LNTLAVIPAYFQSLEMREGAQAGRAGGLCGSTPAGLFLQEDLGEAEAAAGEFPGVLIVDEGDAFLADFG